MVSRTSMCTVLVLLILGDATPASACFAPRDARPSSTEARVALSTALDRPHFYFVINDVVVFIPPEFVYQNRGTLAEAILQVPLRGHTHLLSSLIFGPHKLSDARYIVADALEAGAGLLYNAQFQQFAEEVRVVTFDDVCSGGRRIYYRNQVRDDEVVHTVDWIS